MLADKTDEELVAEVARGETGALGVLFQRHHEGVYSRCYRMTGDSHVAEDLVQVCFLRVLRYAGGFRGDSAFTTWLFRLVRNACIDHLNAEARRRSRVEALAGERALDLGGGESADPRLTSLRRALYSLAPEKREVLVLSRYEGLSYAEIAEMCGATVSAIKVRAHRAMRELRQRIEELEQAT